VFEHNATYEEESKVVKVFEIGYVGSEMQMVKDFEGNVEGYDKQNIGYEIQTLDERKEKRQYDGYFNFNDYCP
jgi:hypothetical protein